MVVFVLCGAVAGCDTNSETTPDDGRAEVQEELRGAWLTPCSPVPDSDPPAFSVYEVKNNGETGTFRYGMYADEGCTVPLVDFILESKQEVGAALPDIGDDVYELNVYYKKLTATPHVDGYAQALQGAGCGTGPYAVGTPVDFSDTGCFFFKPIAACEADYDIMKIDADRFYNGVRTADMCTPDGRPTQLNAFWFDRTE
ncbi:MAG: hypothetical protein R3F14_05510 [Polyangiaceae bacterium]